MNRPPLPVLEVGGTHVEAATVELSDGAGRILQRRRLTLAADATPASFIERLLEAARALDVEDGRCWSVAVPGPFDYEQGVARFSGVGKFAKLNGFDVRAALREGVPAAEEFVFINDADAFLLGEWHLGSARGYDRAAGLTLGTGIGSALMAGGLVATEPDVLGGGRAYRLSIGGRPLEDTVSRRAIVRRYQQKSGTAPEVDIEVLAARARCGDGLARLVIEEAMTALGQAARVPFLQFGAQIVVVGGGISNSWDIVGAPLTQGLNPGSADVNREPALEVVVARTPDAALVGAAVHARRNS